MFMSNELFHRGDAHAVPIEPAERVRLQRLTEHGVFGTPPEPQFDTIVRLAADLFATPMAFLSLIGAREQWLKAGVGLDLAAVPRAQAICDYTVASRMPLILPDAADDPQFAHLPCVSGAPGIRFYAGAPVFSADGQALGALCVADFVPRAPLDRDQLATLVQLAAVVSAQFGERHARREAAAVAGYADASNLAVITVDAEGAITSWSAAATALFGHDRADVIGRPFELLIPDRFQAGHRNEWQRLRRRAAHGFAGRTVELTARDRLKREFPVQLSLAAWQGAGGVQLGAQVRDVSARRAREGRLGHLGRRDQLTGLLNRDGFLARVDAALRGAQCAALLAIDLEAFRRVNDSLGYATGDAVLQAVALRLSAMLPSDGALARIGGDTFMYLLPPDTPSRRVLALAAQVVRELRVPFHVDHHTIPLVASVGVASAPDDARSGEELMLRADLALKEAKAETGRRVRRFDGALARRFVRERRFRDDIATALAEKQWELFYQPQVRIETGRAVGAEALLRWRHPEHGLIGPDVFLAMLEEHPAAHEVGDWVINEACRQLVRWREEGVPIGRVSVNLFPAQVRAGLLTESVAAALRAHDLPPEALDLEITERTSMAHQQEALSAFQALFAQGVGISFDDFGTGYASLSALKQLPLSRLKIDRSFVSDMVTDPSSAAIIAGVVTIAQRMGVTVVAEGVETAEQVRLARLLGCDEAQGFHYGVPMSAAAMTAWLDEQVFGAARHPGV